MTEQGEGSLTLGLRGIKAPQAIRLTLEALPLPIAPKNLKFGGMSNYGALLSLSVARHRSQLLGDAGRGAGASSASSR